jgi:GNAT superfamily N-acetyltransferase
MEDAYRIRRVTELTPVIAGALAGALADVLLDVVEGGASVGFLWPLPRERALAFWEGTLASVARGERILFVAEERATGAVVGTVHVILTSPDNQPHRGEVAKMQVRRSARNAGLGAALLREAEAAALAAGKTLLVLDTATGDDAERLYERLGWVRVGEIPDYALWPRRDGYCSTTLLYRRLDR